jgi:hypothetical protein
MDMGQLETEGLVTILAEMLTTPSTQTAGKVTSGMTQRINWVMINICDLAPLVISDKLAELFVKSTRVQHTKYDLISLLIDNQDKLDDTYNLEKSIDRTHLVMENGKLRLR